MRFLIVTSLLFFIFTSSTFINIGANSIPIFKSSTDHRTPTLMISLDGFRADYLDEFLKNNPESNLQKLMVEAGVKAEYMRPSFPSLTFPNHYTLVTGLYMESHGIIGNSFYDPKYNEKINLIGNPKGLDIKFWNATEPIWDSAKKQVKYFYNLNNKF